MSMNLNLCAEIDAVLSNGKKRVIRERFHLLQTPTTVTRECLKSTNVKQAYINWLEKDGADFWTENHIEELNKWIKDYKDWKIKWYEM